MFPGQQMVGWGWTKQQKYGVAIYVSITFGNWKMNVLRTFEVFSMASLLCWAIL
jgi:hypothetical protein